MATIGYQAPRLIDAGPVSVPNIYQVGAGGATLIEGDFATISGGVLSKAAANAAVATIAGMIRQGTTSVYASASPGYNTIFGVNQAGTALVPGTNSNPQVFGFTPGMQFEMSLNQATTLASTLVGTQAGINYDATSGFFFVDTTQTNKIFNIVQVSGGPDSTNSAFGIPGVQNGVLGDLGGRVIVEALPGAALI